MRFTIPGFLVVACAVVLAGCVSHPPLQGTPQESGMVVVDAVAKVSGFGEEAGRRPIAGITLKRREDGQLIDSARFKSLFLMTGLEPGSYELLAVTAQLDSREVEIPVPADMRGDFLFTVAAGEVVYVGIVDAQIAFAFPDPAIVNYQVTASTKRQRKVFTELLSAYQQTPWVPSFKTQVRATSRSAFWNNR